MEVQGSLEARETWSMGLSVQGNECLVVHWGLLDGGEVRW